MQNDRTYEPDIAQVFRIDLWQYLAQGSKQKLTPAA